MPAPQASKAGALIVSYFGLMGLRVFLICFFVLLFPSMRYAETPRDFHHLLTPSLRDLSSA